MRFVFLILLMLGLVNSGTLPIFQDKFYQRKLFSRSTSLAPIRVFFDYQNFNLGSTALNEEFQLKLVKFLNNFLTNSVKTFSLLDSLAISEASCGPLISLPLQHIDPGLAGYDLITYFSSISSETADFTSYSGICDLDSTEQNRVTAGYIMLNSFKFNQLSLKAKFATILQEMTHILAFSTELYPYWKNFTGQLYEKSRQFSQISIRGTNKITLVTQNVTLKAQEAFGCSTLTGVELEEYQQTGLAALWDKRILFNDYMTSTLQNDFIISTVTLALLRDSGWYDVDYSRAQVPVFGKGSGCGFFNSKCIVSGTSSFPDLWCTSPSDLTCDSFANSKAFCNLATWTSVPLAFQYFTTSSSAGSDGSTDYCPYFSGYNNGYCKGTSVGALFDERTSEVYGSRSKCFRSTLIRSPDNFVNVYAACYEVISCSDTAATVKVGDFNVLCPFTGGSVSIDGFNGVIYCPSSNVLCRDAPCPAACFGSGKCVNGFCVCDSGFSGDDCSVICPDNCKNCLSDSTCTTCNEGFYLNSGVCIFCISNCNICSSSSTCGSCKAGYYLATSTSCVKCSSVCTECKSSTLCTACVAGRYLTSTWTCSSCPSNCDTCTSSSICSICKIGYFKTSTNTCSLCPSTCRTCSSSTICIDCKPGNYLNSNNACIKCVSPCSSCQSSSVCFSCNAGFYLSSSFTCLPCTKGCISCSVFEACKQCGSGYYYLYSTNKCGTCSSGCSTCDNTLTCKVCKLGFFLNSQNTCSSCPTTCSACSSGTVCTSCKNKYYLSSSSCLACVSPCLNCSSATTCTSCIAGFFLSNGSCLACISPCKTCSSATTCVSCLSGFYLSSGRCLACPSKCFECTSLSSCSSCLAGFTLVSGLCY